MFIALLPLLLLGVAAQMDPDMSMDSMDDMGGMTSGGMMMPWMHFSLGDSLWFSAWVPQSKGALAGACIGLFMLAIIERWHLRQVDEFGGSLDLAAVWGELPSQDPQQGALTRAVLADETHTLTRRGDKVDARQDELVAEALADTSADEWAQRRVHAQEPTCRHRTEVGLVAAALAWGHAGPLVCRPARSLA